jgi:hypothetical protein
MTPFSPGIAAFTGVAISFYLKYSVFRMLVGFHVLLTVNISVFFKDADSRSGVGRI